MKKLYFLQALAVALLISGVSVAQISSGSLFLQGRFLEIGAQPNGSLGSGTTPPSGYHATSAHGGSSVCGSSLSLASIYDFGHDGWTTGTPNFMGDYTLPGTPWEGWGVQYGGTANYANANSCSITGSISGSFTSYSSAGGRAIGTWVGTAGSSSALGLVKEHRIDTNGSALIVTVTFKNTTSSTLSGLYYMRSCDPDNSVTWGGNYSTVNAINYQNDYRHRVMVSATATGPASSTGTPPAPISLATKDCRCKALIFTSWPLSTSADLASVWSGGYTLLGTSYYTPGQNTDGDIAIGLVCKLGDLAPYDSTVISYAYVYNGAVGIDSAFPEPQMVANGGIYDSNAVIASCAGATVPDSLPVTIINSSDGAWRYSNWTWSPSTGLTSTTGTSSMVITTGLTAPITYTITGTDTIMGNCAQKIFTLTIVPVRYGPPVVSDVYYCQYDIPSFLSATGVSLLWYTTPTGGTGSTTPPMPSTDRPGTYTFYVSQAPCGASTESARAAIRVYVIGKPVANPMNSGPVCAGSPLNLYANDTGTLGIRTYSWSGPGGFTSTLRDPIIPSSTTADSGVYTLVISASGCVSDPASTLAIVRYAPPAPGVTQVSYCQYALAVPALATGTNLLWYAPRSTVANTIAPTPNTAIAGLDTFFVTQTVNGCEGPAAMLVDTVKPEPVSPTVVRQWYCQYAPAMPVSVFGSNLLWTGTGIPDSTTVTPTPNTSVPGLYIYSIRQTINGCISAAAIDTVPVIPQPSTPLPFDSVYCQYTGSHLLIADGRQLNWYTTPSGGVRIDSIPKAPTDIPGSTTWYVTQTVLGCESERAALTVTTLVQPDFSIHINDQFVCQYDSLIFSYSGIPLTQAGYRWSLPVGAHFMNGTTSTDSQIVVRFDSLRFQYVSLLASNYNGRCSSTDSVKVKVVYQPYAVAFQPENVCVGDTVTVALSMRSGNADHFTWNFDGGTIITANSNSGGPYRLSWNSPGLKLITMQAFTEDECKSVVGKDTIRVLPKPVARIEITAGLTLCPEDSVWITAPNESSQYSYHWRPEKFFHNNNRAGIWARVYNAGYISVDVTDAFGCSASDSVNVNVESCCTVLFPGAFTPNNDGKNDQFRPMFKGFHRFHTFRVVNRWGQTIFETVNSDNAWDGTFNGDPQDMGTYYYYLRYDCLEGGSNNEKVVKGEVTLIR